MELEMKLREKQNTVSKEESPVIKQELNEVPVSATRETSSLPAET